MPDFVFDRDRALRIAAFELQPRQRVLLADGQPVPIGSPTFDLLHCLARHDGRTVSVDELRRTVWPNRKVGDNNLRVQVTLLRRVLGEDAVVRHAGVGYRLALPVQAADEPSAADEARLGNLGPRPPPLIGRDAEHAQLIAWLAQHQRVTLVGAAGIGKTMLALSAAAAAAKSFDDGAWWVELAPLVESSQVYDTVAATLQLGLRAGATPEALARAFAGRRLLLVLDNCEHRADAIVALADALLRAAPGVHVLATSRRVLKCAGEQALRLAPLGLPDEPGLAAARRSPAVALFESRARQADPRFALTPDNVDAVADICTQLDGLPLALTLAAARVPLLGTAALRDKLGDRLRLLSRRGTDADDRHHSLLAALEWSYDLLTPNEQRLLRRLGVFAGSFGLESVKALAGDPPLAPAKALKDDAVLESVKAIANDAPLDEWTLLDALQALLDHSLLQADVAALHAEEAPRYRMHESVRAYARQRLQESGADAHLQARHARHVLALVQGAPDAARAADNMQPALADADLDNLRAALAWAQDHDVALALQLAISANTFFRQRGHHGEAARVARALLSDARTAQHPLLLARLHLARCALCLELNELDAMKSHVDAALALLPPLGETGLLGHAWAWAGTLHNYRRDFKAADAAWRQALQFHVAAGHRYEEAVTRANIGCQQAERGLHDEARASLQQALRLHRELDKPWGIAVALENLGELDYLQGRYDTAFDRWTEALAAFRTLRHGYHEALVLRYQAQVLRRLGQPEEARERLSACLAIAVPQKFAGLVADGWCVLAALVLEAGDARRAAALLHAAKVLRQGEPPAGAPLEHDLPRIEAAVNAALLATARGRAQPEGTGWAALARTGDLAALRAQDLA